MPRVRHKTLFAALVAITLLTPRLNAQARPAAPVAAAQPEFTILILEDERALAARTSATGSDAYWNAYDAFAAALARAGVLRGGSALDEHRRSTVRGSGTVDAAAPRVRLGGYFVITAPDLAAAEAWARQAPPQAVLVEVRPHRPNPHMMAPGAPSPARH